MNRGSNFAPNEELGAGIWLAKNTALKAIDISNLLMSVHEFQAILLKSGTCTFDIPEINPIECGMLAEEQVDAIVKRYHIKPPVRKIKRYIPRMLRGQIPGVIIWLNNHYASLTPRDIAYALGTTPKRVKETLLHDDIEPVHPVASQVLSDSALKELVGHLDKLDE
jgi:hypothetical protein